MSICFIYYIPKVVRDLLSKLQLQAADPTRQQNLSFSIFEMVGVPLSILFWELSIKQNISMSIFIFWIAIGKRCYPLS